MMAGTDQIYEQLSLIGKALSSPKRILLLHLLCQGERSVEHLAAAADMHVANTSAHLQILRRCHLVETRRFKQSVYYRLADDDVERFFLLMRELAEARNAAMQRLVQDFITARDELEPVRRDELVELLEHDEVVVIDVRPWEEYESAHISGAISIPLGQLVRSIPDLPRDKGIVAYCRGPYCVLAPEAVAVLREHGFSARRLEDGLPEWRMARLPVAGRSRP
jgi:rhodanese-related sulfurtransferase